MIPKAVPVLLNLLIALVVGFIAAILGLKERNWPEHSEKPKN